MKIFSFFLTYFCLYQDVYSFPIHNNQWNPKSWTTKKIYQNIEYPDVNQLNKVTNELDKCFPLIFAGEADLLKNELIKASNGEAFILMGGDCAETFREFNTQNIMNTYRVLLQMTLIFMYGLSKPVVKIGRMAGQFAKPRSEMYETINNITLPSYRGDIVNFEEFNEISRIPNPELMIKAYSQSVQIMNLIRALSEGGYADIDRSNDWNLHFYLSEQKKESEKYGDITKNVNKALLFIKALGIDKLEESKRARFYTAHESLLLPYETSLTRKDSITQNYYGCSAHMLWLGERTRMIDGAHVEYLRGIENPIGIKISHKYDCNNIEQLIRTLNPLNKKGKIILIIRMGEYITEGLPSLLYWIEKRKLNVVWVSDPMHGNTVKLENGIKTRYMESIKKEYTFFHQFLKQNNVYPAGIHLEMTGRNVTECIQKNMNENDITNYESSCDPRLSESQCIDLAFYIVNL
jgi:3-deoxy-7-phosphoheptulonate synthase